MFTVILAGLALLFTQPTPERLDDTEMAYVPPIDEGAGSFFERFFYYDKNVKTFIKNVNHARALIRQGDNEQARAELYKLNDMLIALTYPIWVDLAEAECKLGNIDLGLRWLAEFRQATNFNETFKSGCYLDGDSSKPVPGVLPNTFSAFCFTIDIIGHPAISNPNWVPDPYWFKRAEHVAQVCARSDGKYQGVDTVYAPPKDEGPDSFFTGYFGYDQHLKSFIEDVNAVRAQLRQGKYESAKAQLDGFMRWQMINYPIWIDLAEAECKLGNTQPGQDLIADYLQAINVESGKLACYRDSSKQVREPGISDRVFSGVCDRGERMGMVTNLEPDPYWFKRADYVTQICHRETHAQD